MAPPVTPGPPHRRKVLPESSPLGLLIADKQAEGLKLYYEYESWEGAFSKLARLKPVVHFHWGMIFTYQSVFHPVGPKPLGFVDTDGNKYSLEYIQSVVENNPTTQWSPWEAYERTDFKEDPSEASASH